MGVIPEPPTTFRRMLQSSPTTTRVRTEERTRG
jgi:hypothetical protein